MAPVTNEAIKVIKQFLDLAAGAGFNIEKAILFGSYAKGAADRWSDMDLALVSPDFTGIRFNDIKALIPLLLNTDARIEVHPFKPDTFTRNDFFVAEILDHGINLI